MQGGTILGRGSEKGEHYLSFFCYLDGRYPIEVLTPTFGLRGMFGVQIALDSSHLISGGTRRERPQLARTYRF